MATTFMEEQALRKLSNAKYILLANEGTGRATIRPKFIVRHVGPHGPGAFSSTIGPKYLSDTLGAEEAEYTKVEETQSLADLRSENTELRSYINGHLPHREFSGLRYCS